MGRVCPRRIGSPLLCCSIYLGYKITRLRTNDTDDGVRNLFAAINPVARNFYNITLDYVPDYTPSPTPKATLRATPWATKRVWKTLPSW